MSSDTLILTSASETKACAFDGAVTVTFNANLKAPLLEDSEQVEQRKCVDIVCVIDKSGSMSGEPMTLVKETLVFMVSQLKQGDRLSLVTFGDDASLVFSLTDMNEDGKAKALRDISGLRADGWTHLSGGVFSGLDQLASRDASTSNAVSSILVFTDGQANRGITDVNALVRAVVNRMDAIVSVPSAASNSGTLSSTSSMSSSTSFSSSNAASKKAPSSLSLHTFGFSQNHNPELLTRLAEAANGVFYYIPNVGKIPEVFADCLGGLLSVVAMNVVLEAELEYTASSFSKIHTPFPIRYLDAHGVAIINPANNPPIDASNLAPYGASIKKVQVQMGQMYSEQSRDVLFEVLLPQVDHSDLDAKVIKFSVSSLNRQEQLVESSAFAIIDRVEQSSPAIQEVNQVVVQQKARIITANAMRDALSLKSAGRTAEAKQALSSAKASLSGYQSYVDQLNTAEEEISTSGNNAGYLWTNMRAHYAQQSASSALDDAQSYQAMPAPTSAAPTANAPQQLSQQISGYSNSIQRKMKAAAPRSFATTSSKTPTSAPPQQLQSQELQPQQQLYASSAIPTQLQQQQMQTPQQLQQPQQMHVPFQSSNLI